MSSYDKATEIKETHAKMNRIGQAQDVINALQNRKLTRPEVAAKTGIPESQIRHLLPELKEYEIIEGSYASRVDDMMVYSVNKPSKIESLKADMMGATA